MNWKEQIPYLITKEKVTYLRAKNNKSSLIELAVLDRSSGKLRLNIELAKGKELTMDYQCKQVNP